MTGVRPTLLLLGIALAVLPLGAEEKTFRHTYIEFQHGFETLVTADIDADGKKDLIVQQGATLHVFFLRKRGYSPIDSSSRQLPAATCLWAPAEVAGDRRAEILLVTPEGLSYLTLQEDGAFSAEPTLLMREKTFFPIPLTEPPPLAPLVLAAAVNGRDRILFPGPEGFLVAAPGEDPGGAYSVTSRIPVTSTLSIGTGPWGIQFPLTVTRDLPPFHVLDTNRDDRPDLCFLSGADLRIHRATPEGTIPAEPTCVFPLAPIQERQRGSFRWPLPPSIDDINGDGHADLLLTRPGQGTTMLFLGRGDATAWKTPDQVLRTDGWTLAHFLQDLDGDGRQELALVRMAQIGIGEALQVLITRTVDLDLLIYGNRPDGTFSERPERTQTFSVPLVFSVSNQGVRIESPYLVNFAGDLDGDGRKDLVVKTSDRALSVYRGVSGGDFNQRPAFTLETIDAAYFTGVVPHTDDVNGDGRSDLFLHYSDLEDDVHTLEVFLSK